MGLGFEPGCSSLKVRLAHQTIMVAQPRNHRIMATNKVAASVGLWRKSIMPEDRAAILKRRRKAFG